LGVTTIWLTVQRFRHDKNSAWLTTARREIDGVREEVGGVRHEMASVRSEMAGVRTEVGSGRNEVVALISAGKSETLLALSNFRNETLLTLSGLEGRVIAAESATNHVSDQMKDLAQTVTDGFARWEAGRTEAREASQAIPPPPYGTVPAAGSVFPPTTSAPGAERDRS
jgi:hypothetical protein